MSSLNKAIGGYFELELPPVGTDYHHGALKYQSARSAFLSLLRSMPDVKRVWMPYYICDTMLSPVQASSKEIIFYSLDENFTPKDHITLEATDILLYVNYFGVCSKQVKDILQRLNPMQVVIDCSQAFYSEPSDCLATLYSPRKFFGIPDGGLLDTAQPVIPPNVQDSDSINRMNHLIHRLASPAESGYESYKQAENSLQEIEPKRMSDLTDRLLSSICHDIIKKHRRNNFDYLNQQLSATNQLNFSMSTETPMCFPYMPNNLFNKDLLLKKRIYTATYWPDVLRRVQPNSIEANFTQHIIPIPCDQRYTLRELEEVVKEIKIWN